jgi:hypothetical protein
VVIIWIVKTRRARRRGRRGRSPPFFPSSLKNRKCPVYVIFLKGKGRKRRRKEEREQQEKVISR